MTADVARHEIEVTDVDVDAQRVGYVVLGGGARPPAGTYLAFPLVGVGVPVRLLAVTVGSEGESFLRVGRVAAGRMMAGSRLLLLRPPGLPSDLAARLPGSVLVEPFGDALSPLPLQRELPFRIRIAADGSSASAEAAGAAAQGRKR